MDTLSDALKIAWIRSPVTRTEVSTRTETRSAASSKASTVPPRNSIDVRHCTFQQEDTRTKKAM